MQFTRRIPASLAVLSLLLASPGWAKRPTTVRDSLAWLARHQLQDGSWRFDRPDGGERGYANPGTWKANAGATGLALLPFLGAGQTHKTKSPYQKHIENGLHWLMVHQHADGDLSTGGTPKMFSHAVATIAMCEAYMLTGDNTVGAAAQKAVQFIVASRDVKTSDRSDSPNQPITLSVCAWEIMALRSAKMADLKVPPAALEKAGKLLARFQTSDGKYGETGPRAASDAATAMGLLSRSSLGGNPLSRTVFGGRFTVFVLDESSESSKKPKEPAAWVTGGQQFLSRAGFSAKDCLCNLYATVYVHELSGSDWDAWNRKMQKELVDAQVKVGDEAGSWWNADDVHAAEGGRLLQTAINTLMLEVYY